LLDKNNVSSGIAGCLFCFGFSWGAGSSFGVRLDSVRQAVRSCGCLL